MLTRVGGVCPPTIEGVHPMNRVLNAIVAVVLGATSSISRGGSASEPEWHRVAFDDAGVPGLQPHLIAGENYAFPVGELPASVVPEGHPLRTVAFGQRVRFGYAGLRDDAQYRLLLSFVSDGPRVERIACDGTILQERLELAAGRVVQLEFAIAPGLVSDGEICVELRRLGGPNAVVSEVEVLSSDPTPLQPLKDPRATAARALENAVRGLPVAPARLSPRPESVGGVARALLRLDGEWAFSTSLPIELAAGKVPALESWSRIHVPGEWAMQGFSVPPETMACYARCFEIPADWAGKRFKLRFDAVHSVCRVWVNGLVVGEHEGGFVPFEFDITNAAKPGENVLCVGVQSESVSDTLASISQYAAHQVGGILRKVTLFAKPEVNLAALVVTTKVPEGGSTAQIEVDATLAAEVGTPAGARLELELFAPDGGPVTLGESSWGVAGTELRHTLVNEIVSPRLWDSEHPRLYTLRAALVHNGQTLETVSRRVGVRQIEVRGNRLLVNARPIKLLGVCRHEVHPLLGRSLTPALSRRDAELFRAANCNYIRTSHYPPSEEFLDACDELGLFVESEAALCWVQHGANPIWQQWDYLDPAFLPFLVRANDENVMAGRDHPCVLFWSLANESSWSPLWEKVLERVRILDPTRPVTFHDQCWGEYNNAHSTAPIAVYHYPGENGPEKCDAESRPVLFGEYAHVECYNRRELVTDPGIRDDWGRPLERMVDLMQQHPGCLGGAIWSGIDDTFHMPDGRIVGYGPWGPLDGWRRTKPEYWHMKKAYSPIRIFDRHTPFGVDHNMIKVGVENRYLFTDMGEVKVDWRLGSQRGVAAARIAPRSRGTIEIGPIEPHERGEKLELTFTDPRGFICETEALTIEPRSSSPDARPTPPAPSLRESEELIEIASAGILWNVDRATGGVSARTAEGTTLVVGGPTLMLLPLSKDTGGTGGISGNDYQNHIQPFTPTCNHWCPESVVVERQSDAIQISVVGSYDEAHGGYTLRFTGNGAVEVAYAFTVQDAVDPRQWGVVFDAPARMDTLRWERRAQWTTYPEDHIGRSVGTARARAQHRDGVEEPRLELDSPWSLDTSDMGSNDFRSTKYHVQWASLTDTDGRGFEIIPKDTESSVRAWVNTDKIHVLIAGFHTGGADGFYATHFSAERRPLAALQGRVERTFVLRPVPGR